MPTAEVLTHTKRRDFLNCPRYYFHRHEQRLVPVIQKAGRRRGSAFGSAIFGVADSGIPLERDDVTLREVLEASIHSSYAEAFDQAASQAEAEALQLEVTKIQEVAFGYIRKYGIDHRREVVFDLPLVNPATGHPSRTFRRGGKIDGLIRVGQDRWRVIEDKLVGQIQKAMIDRLPLDMQSNEYVDALISVGMSAEVAYRHTLLPGSEPRLIGSGKSRRRESLDEYQLRLREDIIERPEHYFDEQILQFPTDRLADYRRGRWGTARKIMDARLVAREDWQQAFPQNPSRCWEYGGCEFIPLCTRGAAAQHMYTEAPDNPELGEEDGGEAAHQS